MTLNTRNQLTLQALRVFPVLTNNSRVALQDTTLPVGGGKDGKARIFMAVGSTVKMNYYVLHRLPALWGDDADEFRPERWEGLKLDTFQYLPFGGGMRQCIGQQKALMEASYVITRILQEFTHIESRDSRPWKGHVHLSAHNAHGCNIALFPA